MKVERNIFFWLGVFYAVMTAVYWYNAKEVVGLFALGLSAVMSWMIAGYLMMQGRKNDVPLSDVEDAEIMQAAGTLGFFPPHSIWPFWCAVIAALLCLGVIFGWWLVILAFGAGIWAVSGWVFEYYRGDYAH